MNFTPRPHQHDALSAVTNALETGGRAQLRMACGTGKTLVGRWAAQRLDANVTVVACPSIALVAQTVRAWREADGWDFEAILICSDPTSAQGAREREGGEPDRPWWARYGARVTTDAGVVAAALRRADGKRPLVIFSTHHSAPVVAQALQACERAADLLIADEAHHLAGMPREDFKVLTNGTLAAAAAIYMTATPITAHPDPAAALMDDDTLFGQVAYELTFAQAVAAGLLTNFRVLVYEAGHGVDADALSAVRSGISGDDQITRVLTFHGRVAKARGYAQALDGYDLPDGRAVVARAVSGLDSEAVRQEQLSVLHERTPGQVALVASARCLSEGVDLPSVDAALFADPRSSSVDITQAVGRVMRLAPGKTVGTVLLPVVVPSGDQARQDDDAAASVSPYRHVWRVLQALAQLDPDLADELADHESGVSRQGQRRPTNRVQFKMPSLADVRDLIPRAADTRTVTLAQRIEALTAFAVQHEHTSVPTNTSLGRWAAAQRARYVRDSLEPEVVRALQAVPHWAWRAADRAWAHRYAVVHALAHTGRLDLHDAEYAGTVMARTGTARAMTVGQWCASQRASNRAGTLRSDWVEMLTALPGWDWAPTSEHEEDMVDLLGEYARWKGEANPPAGFVEDGLPLGSWVAQVRRARAFGNLDRALADDIEHAVAPVRNGDGKLRWNRGATMWRVGLEALNTFAAREGHLRVPDQWVETLTDTDIPLSVWCRNQRREHRTGRLHPTLVSILDAVPGWRWEIQPAARVLMDIGDARHGSRTGYIKGCRCDPCTVANTTYNATRTGPGAVATDWVDAGGARGKLLILSGQGASQKAMARAAGLNTKSIGEILSGERKRVTPSILEAITALTMADVREADAGLGGLLVDAGPTWELLNDLISRGFPKAWIATELGQSRSLQIRADRVTQAKAAAVVDLHARVGTRVAPQRQHRAPMPSLAQILAADQVPAAA